MRDAVLLTHPGTQYSYQLARQLARHSLLREFWTGFALPKQAWYTRALKTVLPRRGRRGISNRIIEGVPAVRLRTMPLMGVMAARRSHGGRSPQAVFHEYNEAFQRRIPAAAIRDAAAVIGFDTASWLTAERARSFGAPFFLDQSATHPHVRDGVMREVAARFPRWAGNYETRLPHVFDCERMEHELATQIVVASSFTRRSLVSQGVPAEKIHVNPYGVDLRQFRPASASTQRAGRPLRFLFLGSVSALKGVPLLLDVWRRLDAGGHELHVVGHVGDRFRALIPERPGLKVVGKVPHESLPELVRGYDVLVFPSYGDGFGLVILEALASGLPVITTFATGGPDLIDDGAEGFLIEPGDAEALGRSIKFFMERPERLPEMAAAARRKAERYSWDAYGDRWSLLLGRFVG